MGLYDRYLLPRLLHVSMKNPEVRKQRARIVPAAAGRVLEIGIGSGLNLQHYGSNVTSVDGIDPSPALLGMAGDAAVQASFPVTLHHGSAEALPFAQGAFDTVLSTWTMCSIPDIGRALTEIRRVLKPGGALIFIEHGRAPAPAVARWQARLDPLWGRCAGGCHLNRDIVGLVEAADFRFRRLDEGYLVKGPKFLTWHFDGEAVLS